MLSAFKGLNEKLRQQREEGKRLHRHKEEGARERHNSKISLKSNWFNKPRKLINSQPTKVSNPSNPQGLSLSQQRRREKRSRNPLPNPPLKKQDTRKVETVIFIPHTANSSLRKHLQTADDEITRVMGMGRTKYIEEAGTKLSSQLVVKNPWYQLNGGCGRSLCYPCISSKGKGLSCRSESICYEIVCKLCKTNNRRTIYIGETSRSGYERILEHMVMFKAKKEGDPEKQQQNSVFWAHSRDSHLGQMKTFDWEIKLVSSHKSALNRQVTEATRIAREKKTELLNSKMEFGANNLAEITLKYGTKIGTGGSKRKREDEDDREETNPPPRDENPPPENQVPPVPREEGEPALAGATPTAPAPPNEEPPQSLLPGSIVGEDFSSNPQGPQLRHVLPQQLGQELPHNLGKTLERETAVNHDEGATAREFRPEEEACEGEKTPTTLQNNLSSLNKDELKAICAARNVKIKSTDTKAKIIVQIQVHASLKKRMKNFTNRPPSLVKDPRVLQGNAKDSQKDKKDPYQAQN